LNPIAARAALGFALEVPAVLLATQGGPVAVFGMVFAFLALVGARAGGRWTAPFVIRLLIQVLITGAVVALASPLIGNVRSSGALGAYVTIGFLSAAVPRPFFKTDRMGQTITLAVGLLALIGLSRAASKPAFAISVVAFLVAGVIATLARDPSAPRLFNHGRYTVVPVSAAFSLMILVMAGFGYALPAAEPAVSRALSDYLEPESGVSGFGDGQVKLGSLREIITSDAVVMRVFGATDYLRGQVYVNYEVGRWTQQRRAGFVSVLAREGHLRLGDGPALREVRIEAMHDVGRAYFAPLAAVAVHDIPTDSRLDAFGVAVPPTQVLNDDRSWRLSVGQATGRTLATPDLSDRTVPRWLRTQLTDLAQGWMGEAGTPNAKVAALVAALSRFEYSLELDETPNGVDPVLYFLTTARRGHCEYFASALTLLVRSAGVPARMVTGYRVFEFNPAGGYNIVRKRDAHAWVEVWLDGTWQTVDPTPAGALEGEQTPTASWFTARWDVLRRLGAGAFERLASLSLQALLGITVVLALLALLWVWIRRRPKASTPLERASAPLIELEAHLAGAAGQARTPSEPLARYALRLRAVDLPEAAGLVEACAALLYGEQGSADALAAAVRAYVRAGEARPVSSS
jgi:transglutaminase-like putative cysteine protease